VSNSVHRLHVATVNLAGQFNPPEFVDTRIDVYAFLVTNNTRAILIDTGVGEGNAFIDSKFAPARKSLERELHGHGVSIEDVSIVVNNHLHFDHCGNNSLFPNAEVYIQSEEIAVARTPRYTVREWFDYEFARIVPVSSDVEICDGVKLISSPGHTPGHQSVLVQSKAGPILVAAQAAFSAAEYDAGGDPEAQAHELLEGRYQKSIAKLQAIVPATVLFSHDRETSANR